MLGSVERSSNSVYEKMTPLILLPSKRVFLAYNFAFAALGVVAACLIQRSPITATACLLISVPCVAFFSFHLLPGRYQLKLTEDGIEITAFGRTKTIRWSEINRARVGWTAAEATARLNKRIFVFYRTGSLDQSIAIWPSYFGLSAHKFVALMLPFCKDYPRLVDALNVDDEDGAII
jgi:Bacterial PH domain